MTHFRLSAQGHTISGEQFIFTWHVTAPVLIASDALGPWVTALGVLWAGDPTPAEGIGQFYPTTYGIDLAQVDELDPVTGKNVRQARLALDLPGTAVDEPLPPQVAVVVSLRTNLPTRAGRGRFYTPGPTVASLDGGKMLHASRDVYLTASQAAIGSMTEAGFALEVYHRASKTGTPVTTIDVGDVFDTQRTRRDKLVESRVSASV